MADRKVMVTVDGAPKRIRPSDNPTAPTQSPGDNSERLATTAFVADAVATATLPIDTDGTLAANSDSRLATQKAVRTFVETLVTGLLDFRGSQDCSANPNYPVGLKGDCYFVSVAGKIGGASGKSVEVGDLFVASANNAGGTEAGVGTSWFVLEHNLVGALVSSNNLSDLASVPTARANLGGTTVGQAYFTLTNPGAVTFPRMNADDTVTALSAAEFLAAIGGGTAGLDYSSPCGLYLSTSSYLAQPMIPTSTTQLTAIVDSGDYALIPNSGATDFIQVSPGVLSLSLSGLVAGKGYDVFLWNAASPTLQLSAAWANSGQFITGATNATPIVITSNAHGLSNGDVVEIDGVLGNTAANGVWNVANKTANTYELAGSAGNGAYISGGWMSSRGTAYLDRLKGILVNGATIGSMGAKRGLYLGSVYASATNTTEQTGKTWYVDNMYNRKKISLSVGESTASWSYSTNTVRQANGNTANQVSFFFGRPRFVTANVMCFAGTTASGSCGVGVDSTTVMSGRYNLTGSTTGTIYSASLGYLEQILGTGWHRLTWLEKGPGVACTWYGYSAGACDIGLSSNYMG